MGAGAGNSNEDGDSSSNEENDEQDQQITKAEEEIKQHREWIEFLMGIAKLAVFMAGCQIGGSLVNSLTKSTT